MSNNEYLNTDIPTQFVKSTTKADYLVKVEVRLPEGFTKEQVLAVINDKPVTDALNSDVPALVASLRKLASELEAKGSVSLQDGYTKRAVTNSVFGAPASTASSASDNEI